MERFENAIEADRRAGFTPFLMVGTAGTVDTGAIDDLDALADICRRERLWFHVDGACGALAMLAPDLAPRLKGIERADSLAFDFHKWGQVPYDAGFILVRDGVLHRRAFATDGSLFEEGTARPGRGLALALRFWPGSFARFSRSENLVHAQGVRRGSSGSVDFRTCALARYLESRIAATPELELLAPVELNIVCFRYRAADAQRVNSRIVIELQESGVVAPSTTVLEGRLAIRAAIVNHRTGRSEIDMLVEKTVALGRALEASAARSRARTTGR